MSTKIGDMLAYIESHGYTITARDLRREVDKLQAERDAAIARTEEAEAKLAEMTEARDNLRRLAERRAVRLARVSKALEAYDAE